MNVTALDGADFFIEKGELCVIVGQSGAGKTTLLNILGGMDRLTSGRVFLDGNEISTRDGRLSLHLLGRHFVVYLMAPDSPGDKGKFPASFVGVRAEDIGNREVRFTYYGDKHPKSVSLPYNVGEKVVINLEEKRYRDVFFFEDCDGVSVENVAIRRFGGMGVVGQRSGNIKVDGLSVHPHAGERVTLTADIVQFINCYGNISITGCEGGLSLDDWINIHGNYLKIVSADGRRLRLRPQHPSQQGFFPYRPGDMVECVTARERKVLATARVCAVAKDPADPSVCEITVDAASATSRICAFPGAGSTWSRGTDSRAARRRCWGWISRTTGSSPGASRT